MKNWIMGILAKMGFKDTVKSASCDLLKRKARRQTSRMYKAYVTKNGAPTRFHFGCGNRLVAGWLNCDISGSEVNIDLSSGKLPFASGSLQHACSQHVIEHLDMIEELQPLLDEVFRCLKTGGQVWLSCPDIEKLCRSYIQDKGQALIKDRQTRFSNYDTRGYPSAYFINDIFIQRGEHKNLFDFDLLKYVLETSNFCDICKIDEPTFLRKFEEFPRRNDDAQTLYVTARKR